MLGDGADCIDALLPSANCHANPAIGFEIDPALLIRAFREARLGALSGGKQVLGYYHSHPNGKASPSAIDQAQAPGDNLLWAIIASDPAGQSQVNFWRDCPAAGFIAVACNLIG